MLTHELEAAVMTDKGTHIAFCACGWKSKPLARQHAAADAHHVHVSLTRIGRTPSPAAKRRTDQANVTVAMDFELFSRLSDRAEGEQRSRPEVLRDALRLYLTQPPRKATH